MEVYIWELSAHRIFLSHELMKSLKGISVREENIKEGHQGLTPEELQGEEAGRRQRQ